MKVKFSKKDSRGMEYVDCSECERGGNGAEADKCSAGGQTTKGRKGGCFAGTLGTGFTF